MDPAETPARYHIKKGQYMGNILNIPVSRNSPRAIYPQIMSDKPHIFGHNEVHSNLRLICAMRYIERCLFMFLRRQYTHRASESAFLQIAELDIQILFLNFYRIICRPQRKESVRRASALPHAKDGPKLGT